MSGKSVSNKLKPTKNKQEQLPLTQLEAHQYTGTIPPASEFAMYGQVIPDAPDRILKVFEENSEHSRQMDKAALMGEIDRDKRAQWMAFAIIGGVLSLTAYALFLGQNLAALLSGFLGIIIAFKGVFSRQLKKKNDDDEK